MKPGSGAILPARLPAPPGYLRRQDASASRITAMPTHCYFVVLFLFILLPAQGMDRWLFVMDNLLVDERVTRLETLIRRASSTGYTHMVLSDSKFSRLATVDPRYFRNVERIKRIAGETGMEIVPAVFPVGYSNDLLWHDPNLAEGPPVRDAAFVARGGVARLESEMPPVLKGGDMEDLKRWDWKDDNVNADQGAARISDPKGANARLVQKVKLVPFRQYHLSVRVKTDHFQGTPEVKVLGGDGRGLNFDYLKTEPTQDWRTHHVVFNSLTNNTVNLYLGAWGAEKGSLWWDDAALEEIGLLNLIRRDGAPLTVKTEAGKTLVEGTDFEPLQDPLMGSKPWPGSYDVYHEPPVIHLKGNWPDGTKFRVSYFHVATIYDGQAMIDIAEPKSLDLLKDQAQRVHAAFGAKGYLMSHDEIRVLGWSEAFRKRGLTPGQLLAENARECVRILRAVNPTSRIYVWNDMFDPHHNAVAGPYYLVNGSLVGSWEGLDRDVIIMQWNDGHRAESLKFFADRGHRQVIAGYYDASAAQVQRWLEAAKGIPGVVGMMYTTWQSRYDDLEKVAAIVP